MTRALLLLGLTVALGAGCESFVGFRPLTSAPADAGDDARPMDAGRDVAVRVSPTFPASPILDDFERSPAADGGALEFGEPWDVTGYPFFDIEAGTAVPRGSAIALYTKVFGERQEVRATLRSLGTSFREVGLVLGMAPYRSGPCNSTRHLIEVIAVPMGGAVAVGEPLSDASMAPASNELQVHECHFEWNNGGPTDKWTQLAAIARPLATGDELGARLDGDRVTVYVNRAEVGQAQLPAGWLGLGQGGSIGMTAIDCDGCRFDDFGGGTIP